MENISAQPMQARVPSKKKKQKTSLCKLFLLANIQVYTSSGIKKKCHTLRLQYLHLSIPTTKKLGGGGGESMGPATTVFFDKTQATKDARRTVEVLHRVSFRPTAPVLGRGKTYPSICSSTRAYIYILYFPCMYIYICINTCIYIYMHAKKYI